MPVQLLSRHWVITDADSAVQEVRGEGVVGEQPLIPPGNPSAIPAVPPWPPRWAAWRAATPWCAARPMSRRPGRMAAFRGAHSGVLPAHPHRTALGAARPTLSTYVVGDIQGCLQPLKCLLRTVSSTRQGHALVSGRHRQPGPRCLKTLRFLYKMRDNLVLVLGNHDLHLLAVAAGAPTHSLRHPGQNPEGPGPGEHC